MDAVLVITVLCLFVAIPPCVESIFNFIERRKRGRMNNPIPAGMQRRRNLKARDYYTGFLRSKTTSKQSGYALSRNGFGFFRGPIMKPNLFGSFVKILQRSLSGGAVN